MRRWPRLWLGSVCAAVAAGCARPSSVPALGTEPELRIGVAENRPSVALGGDGELILTDDATGQPIGSIPAGVRWNVVPYLGGIRLVRPDGVRSDLYPGVFAVNVTEGRFAMADGRAYRGRLNVVRGLSGVLVVNRVSLESYVAGTIGAEMGARRPEELAALRAQAVVSRTFAVKNRGRWEVGTGSMPLPTCATRSTAASRARARRSGTPCARRQGRCSCIRACRSTRSFLRRAGGSTAGVEEVFSTAKSRPYLRPVSDASNGGKHYCDISPRFRWREEWDASTLRAILSRTLPVVMNVDGDGLQPITDVAVTRTTRSGRVGELRIVFERGDVRVPGSNVRSVLRPANGRLLGSQAFELHVSQEGGRVSRLVATGAGSGHGVGFCQWGAVGRARAGQDYRTILATYFPGTRVERLY